MKLLFTRIKFDYESVTDEKELNIMKKYANKSKLYVYLLMGKYNQIIVKNSKIIL